MSAFHFPWCASGIGRRGSTVGPCQHRQDLWCLCPRNTLWGLRVHLVTREWCIARRWQDTAQRGNWWSIRFTICAQSLPFCSGLDLLSWRWRLHVLQRFRALWLWGCFHPFHGHGDWYGRHPVVFQDVDDQTWWAEATGVTICWGRGVGAEGIDGQDFNWRCKN